MLYFIILYYLPCDLFMSLLMLVLLHQPLIHRTYRTPHQPLNHVLAIDEVRLSYMQTFH